MGLSNPADQEVTEEVEMPSHDVRVNFDNITIGNREYDTTAVVRVSAAVFSDLTLAHRFTDGTLTDLGEVAETGAGGDANLKANTTALTPLEYLWRTQINDDGSSTADWLNRFEVRFQRFPPGPGANTFPSVLTFFLNEYGEVRALPAKPSTVALRVFTKEQAGSVDHDPSVNVFEVMSDRDTRVILAGIKPDGTFNAKNVEDKVVTVPTGTIGFASQPDGTLWVEYTP